jgi:hypothetical protein
MFATTTADDPTAPATYARHGRPTPPQISTMKASSVDQFWVGSSTSTNGQRKTAVHHSWPTSGTPHPPEVTVRDHYLLPGGTSVIQNIKSSGLGRGNCAIPLRRF